MPGVGSLRWACTFHALGDANLTQRQPVFWWNMGFKIPGYYFLEKKVESAVVQHTPLLGACIAAHNAKLASLEGKF